MQRGVEKDLVKERVALRDLVAEVVGELKSRGGDDLWACCPFHNEDTPSFHVRPALGVYKCFGCGESGDVFTFVQKTRGVGFREALTILAERAGVELASMSAEDRRRHVEARASRDALEVALKLFRDTLHQPEGRGAAAYMRERGFGEETLRRFDIGVIPGDFKRALRTRGLGATQIDGAGFTAAFGGRLCFGIRDGNGTLVGFGARRLGDATDGPKYVNTRETPWFSKGRLLYGLDKATRSLARTRRLVVMEGYTDVMMAHERGVTEAVATMGTSFTVEHLRLVKARVTDLVLVFDGDAAGGTAAERAVRMVLSEGMECRVFLLPEATDPCDWFGSHSHEDFDRVLSSEGLSSVAFLCRRLLEQTDHGQPGAREHAAAEVRALTRHLLDPVRRETVVREIAQACSLDPNLVRRASGAPARSDAPPEGGARSTSAPRVNALVRCQFVAVAGLAEEASRRETLRELLSAGAIDHPLALALLELAEALAPGEATAPDAAGWLEAAAERGPELRVALERALMPPPDTILPSWDDAVAHLRRHAREGLERAARRAALSRPDIASNGEVLRGVQSSLTDQSSRPAPGEAVS
ncbi:MAG: DNA primase [Planctomycetota bacterium]|jgi:DNA primase